MKLSKKAKIAIITFLALGITGVAVIKIKQFVDKKRGRKKTKPKRNRIKNKAMAQMLKVPDEID